MGNIKRAALYVRVSTEEQRKNGLSVDSQIDALQKYCSDNGIKVVDVYNDAGHSARKKYTTRPNLLRLLEDCKNGKIDVILFTRLDRWFRSVPDYHSVQAVLDENNVTWRAIWEDYETETASGVFKVNIMLAVAQSEADKTSERIRSVKDYQREMGKFVGGQIPLGYKYNKASGQIEIDEDMYPTVRGFFEVYLSTHNLARAIAFIEDRLGLVFSRDRAKRLIDNDYYRGSHNGVANPAYITPEEAEIVDHIRESNRWVKDKPQRLYLFSGLLRCGSCGKNYGGVPHQCRGMTKDGLKIYHTKTYQCVSWKTHTGCSQTRTVFEKPLERYLLKNLDSILADAHIQAELTPINAKNDNSIKRAKLEAKLSRIGQRFEDGDISIDEYRTKRDAIKMELSDLADAEPQRELPTLPENWKDIYKELDDEHRKMFWSRVIKKIVIPPNSKEYLVYFL